MRHRLDTRDLPDATLYTACGNRRAAVCPACAEVYRADTFHLVAAGITGDPGKGVPASVAGHPCLFVTLTAPSFGAVHGQRQGWHGQPRRCRPARHRRLCPHGRDLRCPRVHAEGDPALGRPLCLDCYDHHHQVVWNGWAGELWRRTTIAIGRQLRRAARACGGGRVRISYAKVAEFQARGTVHLHALLRLDGLDPADPDAVIPPPAGLDTALLERAVRHAVGTVAYRTDPHPVRPQGWRLTWGQQVDVRIVTALGTRTIDEAAVAGYLAKYATKATETTGHSSARITGDTVAGYADRSTHVGQLIGACWALGSPAGTGRTTAAELADWRAGYGRLRRWAHMLGFGGHVTTHSRRYSTSYGAERARRRAWRRRHPATSPTPDHSADELAGGEETTLVVGRLAYAGTGWRSTGDALLALTAAAKARERRQVARDEILSVSAA